MISTTRPLPDEIPDEPIERLTLLVVDLIDFAERGGLPASRSEPLYNEIMEALTALEAEEQADLLDRVHSVWSKPPTAKARSTRRKKAN